ncbi:MAG TPA: general stress protein CsbD [Burkholderiales bacterium]|nr:general stress protein CsbD [Burkholderiales bacterium]
MNWSQIETGWTSYTANAKQQWDKLSEEQLTSTLGKREQLTSKVQEAYGISKEESERQISDWQSRQVEQQTVQADKKGE